MITPVFELSQNAKFLIAEIKVPFAKASDVEIHFEGHDFLFYSKPYFLRLNLPGEVKYEEEPSVVYDFEKRIFTIQMEKVQVGKIFQNLEFLSKLLKPKTMKASPLIEVIEGECETNLDSDDEEEPHCNTQETLSEEFKLMNISNEQCGFGKKYSWAIFDLKEETMEIFEIKNPSYKTIEERKSERLCTESNDFNEDYYIADLYDDCAIQNSLEYHPEWEILYNKQQTESTFCLDEKISFTSEEKERMIKLPNKEYILNKAEVKAIYLSMIDIIYAYSYNKRTTEGEDTVESAWTMNKISATLSWMEIFNSLTEVAQSCIRRSITYPLYRHFELSITVLEDVRKILLLGRKYILKVFLDIQKTFHKSEPRYILNDLYITDYCIWIQKKCSTKKLKEYAEEIGKMQFSKEYFRLCDVESFSAMVMMSQDSSLH